MVIAPTTTEASAAPAVATLTESPEASASLGANSTATATGDDAGVPARLRGCSTDTDCIAAPRVGCCHNGWLEAVAASQKDTYAASFVCPEPHPICPMYLIREARVPRCDRATRLCTMTAK